MTYRIVTLVLFFFIISNFSNLYSQEESTTPEVSSASKFNMRGLYENDALNLSGKEIIGDYDGNLMLQYKTSVELPNDLGGDFTVIYNANVMHRVIQYISLAGGAINLPEWILGYKGFALQTCNFETNFYVSHVDNSTGNSEYSGQEVPYLIPGYHFMHNLMLTFPYHDEIQILMADGSVKTFVNTEGDKTTGFYLEESNEKKGFAYVTTDGSTNDPVDNKRKLYYKPGDGLTYEFIEDTVQYNGYDSYSGIWKPTTMYLKKIFSPDDATAAIEFIYDYPNTDPTKKGRKCFYGIKWAGTNRYELKIVYALQGIQCFNDIVIYNVNNSSKLDLHLIGTKDLYDNSKRDTDCLRIQYVDQISDNLNRKDIISYNSQSDNTYKREYGYQSDLKFIPFYNMINKIIYNNSRQTLFDYYGQKFDSDATSFSINWWNHSVFITDNMKAAWRDCYTNMMIKSRTTSNLYAGDSTTERVENYYYSFPQWRTLDNSNIGLIMSYDLDIDSIQTKISIQNSTNLSSQEIIKYFTEWKTRSVNYSILDRSNTIKQTIETTQQIVGEADPSNSLKKEYYYDTGNIRASSDATESYYTGNFDIDSIVTKEYAASQLLIQSSEKYTNFYDYLTFNDGTKLLDTIRILREQLAADPKTKFIDTKYKNFYPGSITGSGKSINVDSPAINITDFICWDDWFYKTGLVGEQVTNNSFDHAIYNYYDSGSIIGKLQQKIYNPGGRQSYENIEYYPYPNINYYGGSLSKITNDKGVTKNYYYPSVDPYGKVTSTAYGFINQSNGDKSYSAFVQQGYQFKPFQTVTLTPSNDTLIYYSSYNNQQKLNYEVDINSNYSFYNYDGIGRLTGAIFPGSFIDNTTPFGPATLGIVGTNIENKVTNGVITADPYNMGAVRYYSYSSGNPDDDVENSVSYNENYYMLFANPTELISPNVNVTSAFLDLYMSCSGITSGMSETFTIAGLNNPNECVPLSSGYYLCNASPYEVTVTTDVGIVPKDILVDVTSIIQQFQSNGYTLYGFEIYTSPSSGNLSGANSLPIGGTTTQKLFTVCYNQKSPLLMISTSQPGGVQSNYSPVINDTSYTVKYSYDDINNKVYNTTRISNLPSSFKEMTTEYDNDALGQLRNKSITNDSNLPENKETKTYDYLGNTASIANGLGIKTQISYDYQSRPVKKKFDDNSYQQYAYIPGSSTISGQSYSRKTVFTDEAGKTKTSYYDIVGNLVAEQDGTNPPTKYNYDDIYRLTSVVTPAGKATYYLYDDLGHVSQKTSPDEGTINYKYDKYGNLRYVFPATGSQDKILFYVYDVFDRLTATGLEPGNSSNFQTLNPDVSSSFETDTTLFVLLNMYDRFSATNQVFSSANFNSASTLENLKGKIAATAYRDKPESNWKFKIYSYDCMGRIKKQYLKE